MTGLRRAALITSLVLAACGPNIRNTVFQSYEVRLNGPAPTYLNPDLDPFVKTTLFRVTLKYFEDAEGKTPYFENRKKPPLFADFTPVQVSEVPASKGQPLTLTANGNDASLPRIGPSQTSVFVQADIVGVHVDKVTKQQTDVARARCPIQELKIVSGGSSEPVVCKAFFGFIGKWNEVRPPAVDRVDFGAVVLPLPDGRVVIGGGRVADDDVADQADVDSIEIYDPTVPDPRTPALSPGRWTLIRNALQPARSGPAAVFMKTSGLVYFLGGWAGGQPQNGFDLLDTATNARLSLTPAPTIGNERADFGAAILDNERILIGGGVGAGLAAQTFTRILPKPPLVGSSGPSMASERRSPCFMGLANGKVLACGGATAENRTDTCELVSVDESKVSGHMEAPRADVKCAVTGPAGSESVYLIGGELGTPGSDPAVIEKWTGNAVGSIAAMAPTALTRHALAQNGSFVYVTGGYVPGTTQPLATGFVLDTETETVKALPEMLNPRAGHQLLALPDGNVMAIGGLSNRPLARVGAEIYVPE